LRFETIPQNAEGQSARPAEIRGYGCDYNLAAKDHVVYAERDSGINLRWNKEINPPRDHRKKLGLLPAIPIPIAPARPFGLAGPFLYLAYAIPCG